jgi:hypothetical protein
MIDEIEMLAGRTFNRVTAARQRAIARKNPSEIRAVLAVYGLHG